MICLWAGKLPQEHRDAADEQLLAAFAGGLGLADLASLFAEMYVRARGDLPDQDPGREFADREVKLATTIGGAGVLHGDLTAGCAAAVAAVLDALGAPAGKEDDRTKGQRYHDALAQGPWPHARAGERVRVLRTIADLVRAHADELMKLQALDNSVPLSFGEIYAMSPGFVADVFDHHAGWADKIAGETLPPYQGGDHMVLTLREPVGVVGAVIPWNAPLVLFAQKVAPALAAGCTVVIKPSEYATFAVLRLAQLIAETGLPAGVLNVVTGPGDPAGQALISHPMVDKLSFTGSRAVGQKVMMAAAAGCKRVSLELGGKSPSVVFADADIGTAAAVTMGTVTLGLSGQVCAAQTRALVQNEAASTNSWPRPS